MTDTNITYTCVDCKEDKGRDGFYKKQWKLKGAGKCKTCWDNSLRSSNSQQQQQPKRKSDDTSIVGGEGSDSNKKPKVMPNKNKNERKCVTCQATFIAPRKKRGGGRATECEDCREKAKQERIKKERTLYYRTYGVAYEDIDQEDHLVFKTEPMVNEALFGKYNLIFFSSFRCCCDPSDKEYIHRTAIGKMELSEKKWSGKPALFGIYSVVTDWMEDDRGGSFIENMRDLFDPSKMPLNGFNIFTWAQEENQGPESKLLVANREESSKAWNWWEHLPKDEEDVDLMNEWNGGALKVVAERKALGLMPDAFAGYEYSPSPQNVTRHELVEKEDNLELAEELMSNYRDGSNSWMCRHLNVPPGVAFCIREFVSPPPVLYVEPGDLVLEIEESREPEWTMRYVFRKVNESSDSDESSDKEEEVDESSDEEEEVDEMDPNEIEELLHDQSNPVRVGQLQQDDNDDEQPDD